MKPIIFRYKDDNSDEWRYTDRNDETYLKEIYGARDVERIENPPLDWVEHRIRRITALIPCVSESKWTLDYYRELLGYYVNYLKSVEDKDTEINISSKFMAKDFFRCRLTVDLGAENERQIEFSAFGDSNDNSLIIKVLSQVMEMAEAPNIENPDFF